MPTYAVYGLLVRTERPLKGLAPVADEATPDVHVAMREGERVDALVPDSVEWTEIDAFGSYFQMSRGDGEAGTYLRLRYADDPHEATFVIGPEGQNIWVAWSDGAPFREINTLLQGPVLGRTLRLRGAQVLHAGALVVDGRALCLVGNKQAGKSTTTIALARRGHAVLTDDLAVLGDRDDGTVVVHPGIARARLRPDVAERLGPGDLEPIWSKDYPNQKYVLDLGGEAREPVPLGGIYELGRREEGQTPHVGAVPAGEAVLSLVAYSYSSAILTPALRAKEFAALGRLVGTVPFRRVYRPDGLDALTAICDTILEDFRALPSGENRASADPR